MMGQKYLIFTTAADVMKDLTRTVIEYTEERPYYANDGTKPPVVDVDTYQFGSHNHKTPRFVISTDSAVFGGTNEGFTLCENPACKSRNDPTWPISRTREGFTVRHMREQTILDFCDKYPKGVFFSLVGEPMNYSDISAENSILNYFKYVYPKNGMLYDCLTDEEIPSGIVTSLYYCVKMGPLPFYVVLVNDNLLGVSILSSGVTYRESGAYGLTMMNSNIKEELFFPEITTPVTASTNKYILYTEENEFHFEMFGTDVHLWPNKEIKANHIPDFNEHLTIKTNVPYQTYDFGKVVLDLSGLEKGQMAYFIISVDCGDFYNKIIARPYRMYFEYVIVKQ